MTQAQKQRKTSGNGGAWVASYAVPLGVAWVVWKATGSVAAGVAVVVVVTVLVLMAVVAGRR